MTSDKPHLCGGLNRKGQPCRAPALPGSHFCGYHQDPEDPSSVDVNSRWARYDRQLNPAEGGDR